ADVAEHGSKNIADVTDTAQPLDAFKAHGGKLLTIMSTNDQAIYPRGVLHYYRQIAKHYRNGEAPAFDGLRKFYRMFRAPGFGHCGGADAAADAFSALTRWVEHGVAPDSLPAATRVAKTTPGRTLLFCPFPQRAIYNGSGSTDDAKSFHCGGNV